MKILVATHIGQCKGLRRILHRTRYALQTSDSKPVYIFRDLVHNRQVHEELFKLGVKGKLNDVNQILPDTTILVGPHSASRSIIKDLRNKARLVDTSCPTVKKVVKIAKSLSEEGYTVVFVGLKNHEEAEMIQDCIENAIVITSESEIDNLPSNKPLGFVCQSTFSITQYKLMISEVQKTGRVIKYEMTVCSDVIKRQQAVIDLANFVDKIIVVGGCHSNNTALLTKAVRHLKPTRQIETEAELISEWFLPGETIGITAGASTPDWVINDVLVKLQQIGRKIEFENKLHLFHEVQNRFRIFLSKARIWTLDRSLWVLEWYYRKAQKQGSTQPDKFRTFKEGN